MANERRPREQRPPTPEEVASFQEMDRQWRLEYMPPQVDVNGMERVCMHCHSILNPIHNRDYDGAIGGFCNKLCGRDYEHKMMDEGMSPIDAMNEMDKYADWKPKKHSTVVV